MADDVNRWLEALDLAKYHEDFVDHEISFSDLTELTEDDLKEMGLPIGPRRRVLKAIAELGARHPSPPSPSGPATAPLPSTNPGAERRQLTVMFCDLVGSTELSTQLDPEDLEAVVRAYQETVTQVIKRFQGYVAKYMGDGVLVYFGYPQAHERDAERAVRTAIEIVGAMAELNVRDGGLDDVELAVRIGIDTGLVVVGEVFGEGEAKERTVVGETPNLAARLQDLAEPDGIVIGSVTRDLAGDAFDYEDLGPHELKGIAGFVRVWGVRPQALTVPAAGSVLTAVGLAVVAQLDAEVKEPVAAARLLARARARGAVVVGRAVVARLVALDDPVAAHRRAARVGRIARARAAARARLRARARVARGRGRVARRRAALGAVARRAVRVARWPRGRGLRRRRQTRERHRQRRDGYERSRRGAQDTA